MIPKLKEIDINNEQIWDLVNQLDYDKKISLVKEVVREKEYKKNLYAYTESLAKKYNFPEINEEELDIFLHNK